MFYVVLLDKDTATKMIIGTWNHCFVGIASWLSHRMIFQRIPHAEPRLAQQNSTLGLYCPFKNANIWCVCVQSWATLQCYFMRSSFPPPLRLATSCFHRNIWLLECHTLYGNIKCNSVHSEVHCKWIQCKFQCRFLIIILTDIVALECVSMRSHACVLTIT